MNPLKILLAQSEREWKCSEILLDEIIFKLSLQAVRNPEHEKVYSRARWSTKLTKFVMASFLPVVVSLPPLVSGSYSSSIASLTFFLMMVGVSFSYSFYSADLSYLHTLPLTRNEISRITLLMFLRYFDWPATLAFVAFIVVAGLSNPLSVIPAAVGFLTALFISLSAIAFLGKKIGTISVSRSGVLGVLARSVFTLTWVFTVYGSYIVFRLILSISESVEKCESMLFLYPFPLGHWISDPLNVQYLMLSVPYIALAGVGARWMSKNLPLYKYTKLQATKGKWKIKRTGRMVALVLKDLRIVARNPQLAAVAALPLVEAVLYLVAFPRDYGWLASALVLQITIAITASTFMTTEKSGYIEVLPLTKREIGLSKVISSLAIYILSYAIVMVVSSHILSLLALFPSGVAVVLFTVILTRDTSSEPINLRMLLSILLSLLLVFLPVAVGGVAFLMSKPFYLYAFSVSIAELFLSLLLFLRT